ncbi:MAG: PilW family protein [Myxococcota bacterium]
MRSARSNQGFTIPELMIAVVLVGLLGMALASSFEGQKRFYNTNERVVETQEDARLVLDLLKQDTRMAGFMVPGVSGIASVDGGALNADRFCVSDSTYFDLPDAATPETTLSFQVQHFLVSDSNQVTQINPPTQVQIRSLDIDGVLTANDFAVGSGVIISDGTTSHCAAIAALDPVTNTITLNAAHALPATPFTLANTRVVPAIIYELTAPPGGGAATNLTRNGQLMSSTIDDLQVEYWAPATPTNAPVHNLNDPVNGLNPATISRVRITVVSRSTQADIGSTKKFNGGQRPVIANRAAGAADAFQRRVFAANVMPRNISTQP